MISESDSDSDLEIESILDEIIQNINVRKTHVPLIHVPVLTTIEEETSDVSLINFEEDDTKLCVICLDESDGRVKNIKDLKNIEKTCDCNFNVHINCFHKWIQTTPVCPYCHELILIKGQCPIGEYRQLDEHDNSSEYSYEADEFNQIEYNEYNLNNTVVNYSLCRTISGCIYTYRNGILMLSLLFFFILAYSDALYF